MIEGAALNVKDFGAVGDGVTDDSVAIQACLDAALSSAATTIIFTGSYACGTDLLKTMTGGSISLVGRNDATINFTTTTFPSDALTIQGTIESGTALLADIAEGDRSLTTSEPLVQGDLLKIESTVRWSPFDAGLAGEFCRVASVSGTTIELEWPLHDSYTAATTEIRRMNAPRVSVSNIKLTRAAATGLENAEGLIINYSQSVKLDRVTANNFTLTGLEVADSFDVNVTQCETFGKYFAGEGQGYGLVNVDCQNFNVSGGIYVGGRHGIAAGGNSVCRNFVVDGATISAEGAHGFDCHSNVSNVILTNCDIQRGMSIYPQSAKVIGNTIYGNLWVQPIKSGGTISICNNDVSEGQMQISTYTDAGPVVTDLIIIKDNRVITSEAGSYALRINTSITGTDTWAVRNLTIKDNYFKTTGTGTPAACAFAGNVAVVTISNLSVVNNDFFSTNGKAFDLTGNDYLVGALTFDDNRCETGLSTGGNTHIETIAGLATHAKIRGNIFTEGTYGVLFNCYSGSLFLSDNVFKDTDVSFDTVAVPNFGLFRSTNNIEDNVTSGYSGAIQPEAIHDPGTGSVRRMVWRSSVPSTGTWDRGSVVFDTTPSASGTIGWTCVTAGTPGTWKTFGAITA